MTKKLTLIQQIKALVSGYRAVPSLKQKIRGLTAVSTLKGYLTSKEKIRKRKAKLDFQLDKVSQQEKKLDKRFAPLVSRDRKVLRGYLSNNKALREKILG